MLNSKTKIKNSFNNTYFEILAALTLEVIGEIDKFNIEIISDKPDIQINNIGFEVTRDLSQEEAVQLDYFNKVYGMSKEDKEKTLDHIDRGKRSRLRKDENLSSMSAACEDPEIIIEAIIKKNAKINNYSNFETVNLYIFTSAFMFDLKMTDEVTELLSKINSGFNNIYIDYHNTVFKYNGHSTEKYYIEEELIQLRNEAVRLNNKYFDNHGNRINEKIK